MTAVDSVVGGTAGGETSNEHGRTGRREQDRSNVAFVTHWKYVGCTCTGEACCEQIEAALAAVVAKNTGSICVNDASRDPYTSSVFHGGLQHRLKWHV